MSDASSVLSFSVKSTAGSVVQMRWYYANLELYRSTTGQHIFQEMLTLDEVLVVYTDYIDICIHIRQCRIDILRIGSNSAVPVYRRNFFKHWWDEIKQRSVASCKLWKSAGKPRSGYIYDIYRKDEAAYMSIIRKKQREEKDIYTNDLHQYLLNKQGQVFWKCWSSKFDTGKCPDLHVNGITNECPIAEMFAQHFPKVYMSNSKEGAARLTAKYTQMRSEYCGNRPQHIF